MDNRQSKAIEKIEKAGLAEKHNQLVAQGYSNPWFNYRLLKEHDGNLDQVITAYGEHKKRKEAKDAKAQQILQTLGWVNKNQELVEKGFTEVKKNLKVLLRAEGDVEKSVKILQLKKEFKTDQPVEQIIEEHGFKVQYEKLKEMGYTNEKRIVRLLLKFNGNMEPVLEKLLSGPDWKHGHGKHGHGHCGKHEKIQKDKESQEYKEFKEKKKEFKQKLHQLRDQGFHPHKAVKFLAIWNGDVNACAKWLNHIKSKEQLQKKEPLQQNEPLQQKEQPETQTLEGQQDPPKRRMS